jgi:hypothetical protein
MFSQTSYHTHERVLGISNPPASAGPTLPTQLQAQDQNLKAPEEEPQAADHRLSYRVHRAQSKLSLAAISVMSFALFCWRARAHFLVEPRAI